MDIRNSLFYFLAALSISWLMGCKNNDVEVRKAIIGNWELKEKTTGSKSVSTIFQSGSGNNLTFEETRYLQSAKGQMVSMGHYKIVRDTIKSSGKISDRLIFKPEVYPEDSRRFFIEVKNNQLIIKEDSVGGITLLYKRFK